MPLGKEHYTTFAEIANVMNHTSYNPQWSKTAECDRLINLIYDESLTEAAPATQLARLAAIRNYFIDKRVMDAEWFPSVSADIRLPVIFYTLGTALSRQGETQIGRCGRFHRALTAVWNETARVEGFGGLNADKRAAYQIWLNNTILQLGEDFGLLEPPLVSPMGAYRINSGQYQINTGADIEVSAGDRLDLVSTGIGFLSLQWQLDGSDVAGGVEERLVIDPIAVPDDIGVYTCVYTNSAGNTASDEFTVVEA